MKKYILLLLCLTAVSPIYAQVFAEYFADKTLRADYIFSGNASQQDICLDGLSSLPTWAGRKHHLAELPLQGNGQIVMRDAVSGKTIYTTSFSSLFQEWLETDEAKAKSPPLWYRRHSGSSGGSGHRSGRRPVRVGRHQPSGRLRPG